MDYIANNWQEIMTAVNTLGLVIIGLFRKKGK